MSDMKFAKNAKLKDTYLEKKTFNIYKKIFLKMKNISVFANFFINDKERYLRTIDLFKSFEKANIEKWIINTRGKYSDNLKIILGKNKTKN